MNFSGLRGAFFVAWKTCVRVDRRRIIRFSTLILTLGCLNRPLATSEGCIVDSAKAIKFTSVLAHQADKYDGIIISDVGLPETCNDFTSHLHYSLQLWKEKGVKGVWLKIPSRKLEYAAVAIDSGFTMHHAEKDYLMLTQWLSEDENKLPPNASHQIGVGCIVINDEGKLLAVQEKNGPLKGLGFWKIPTGLVDAKEDLHVASCREVLEETGIETEFVGLVCFRHAHDFQFGKSDLFFVCLLKPLTKMITKQESEIEASEWIDLDVYMDQKLFLSSPVYSRLNEYIQKIAKNKNPSNYLERVTLPLGNRPGYNTLYLPVESIE